jgi:hypothetical protein
MRKENKFWIRLGIDNLFDVPFPEITKENLSFWQEKNELRWVDSAIDRDGKDSIVLHVGEFGEKVLKL